jgi:hypothetical protein
MQQSPPVRLPHGHPAWSVTLTVQLPYPLFLNISYLFLGEIVAGAMSSCVRHLSDWPSRRLGSGRWAAASTGVETRGSERAHICTGLWAGATWKRDALRKQSAAHSSTLCDPNHSASHFSAYASRPSLFLLPRAGIVCAGACSCLYAVWVDFLLAQHHVNTAQQACQNAGARLQGVGERAGRHHRDDRWISNRTVEPKYLCLLSEILIYNAFSDSVQLLHCFASLCLVLDRAAASRE